MEVVASLDVCRSSSPVAAEPGSAQVTADGGRRAHGRAHLKGECLACTVHTLYMFFDHIEDLRLMSSQALGVRSPERVVLKCMRYATDFSSGMMKSRVECRLPELRPKQQIESCDLRHLQQLVRE